MGVIRVDKNRNYTNMPKYHLRDPRLSLRAKGLMSWMLSLPEDWDYSVAGLAKCCTEGREAVRKVVQELEAAGYVQRVQSRGGGRFEGYDYILHEKPPDDAPSPGKLGDGDAPSPGKLGTGELGTENPPQSNNKQVIPETDPPKAPQGAEEASVEDLPGAKWKPERFEAFWKFYPLHKSKQGAIRAWDKLKPSDELLAVIGKALKRQIAEEKRRAAREHRPYEWKLYASTFLNNARWTDEPAQILEPDPVSEQGTSGRRDLQWL